MISTMFKFVIFSIFQLITVTTIGQITTDWIATNDDRFLLEQNWTNGKPGALDKAQFQFNALQFVLLDEDAQVFELNLFGNTEQTFYGQHDLEMELLNVFGNAELTLEDQTNFVINQGFSIGESSAGTFSILGGSSVKSVTATPNIVAKDSGIVGRLTVSGGNSLLQAGSMIVAESGTGFFDIENSSTAEISENVIVGQFSTSRGRLTVSSDSQLFTLGDVMIGNGLNSDGIVRVDGGNARFESGNSVNDVLVVGSNGEGMLALQNHGHAESQNVIVGKQANGDGNVGVLAGASWNIHHDLVIGEDFNSMGQVRVAGILGSQRSKINLPNVNSRIVVGSFGAGTFMLDTLGELDAAEIVVAENATSVGAVDVENTNNLNCDTINIAQNGIGTMNVNNGNVISESVNLGTGNGVAELNISGVSLFSAQSLDVGFIGEAVVNVFDGAELSVSERLNVPAANGPFSAFTPSVNLSDGAIAAVNDLTVGSNPFGPGLLTLVDSDMAVSGECIIAYNGTVSLNNSRLIASTVLNDGCMEFESGFANLDADVSVFSIGKVEATTNQPVNFLHDLHNDGEVFVGSDCRVNVFGSWSGDGEMTGSGDLHFKGAMNPDTVTALTIEPNTVIEQTAKYIMQIGGTDQSSYDTMTFLNDLDIQDAILNIEFTNGFQLMVGHSFLLAKIAGAMEGEFSNAPEGSIFVEINGVGLEITYQGGDGNDIVLTAVNEQTLFGDVNLDGAVNLLDVAPFVDRITNGIFQIEADCNRDGVVNLLDVAPFVDILTGM